MTCQNPACRHEFCWWCKGAWRGHVCPIEQVLSAFGKYVLVPIIYVGFAVGSMICALPLAVGLPPATALRTEGKPLLAWWWEKLMAWCRNL